MQDIDIIEEYLSYKKAGKIQGRISVSGDKIINSSQQTTGNLNERQDEESNLMTGTSEIRNTLSSNLMMNMIKDSSLATGNGEIEKKYQKVMAKIPKNLQIYASQ